MNDKTKRNLIIAGAIIVAIASFTYGALTAPQDSSQQAATPTPKSTPVKKPTAQQLTKQLAEELPTITNVLVAAYPQIATDYKAAKGQLFDEGQWYGTTLSYVGDDMLSRDTLRVLMQKKNGVWVLRTTPPQLLLSAQKLPDVPRDILITINKPISLP